MNPLMQSLLKQQNKTFTTNGAKAFKSTKNSVLDLFSAWGGMRGKDIIPHFRAAIDEDVHMAIRTILWGRDVREGAGERKLFRDAIQYLLNIGFDDYVRRILVKIPELGRWDDMLTLFNSKLQPDILGIISGALKGGNGLCAKWMPRKGPIANTLRMHMKLTPKQYRKMLVELTNVVEQKMCAQQWTDINYGHVPSKAAQIYRHAFKRHDKKGYEEYLAGLTKGTTKVNAGAVYPYEIMDMCLRSGKDTALADAQWKAQPDYVKDMSFLPIIDCSGSMGCRVGNTTALNIAVSLGLYLSERNKSVFKDMFITFSERPEIQYTRGTLRNRINTMSHAHWQMNTNLEAVFDLVLQHAVKNNVKQQDMPTHMIIVSDMQFDRCVQKVTPRKSIVTKYSQHGYAAPILVFWNVNEGGNKPVTAEREGCVLVSGFSPSIMKTLLTGSVEAITPIAQMEETLMQERYNF